LPVHVNVLKVVQVSRVMHEFDYRNSQIGILYIEIAESYEHEQRSMWKENINS